MSGGPLLVLLYPKGFRFGWKFEDIRELLRRKRKMNPEELAKFDVAFGREYEKLIAGQMVSSARNCIEALGVCSQLARGTKYESYIERAVCYLEGAIQESFERGSVNGHYPVRTEKVMGEMNWINENLKRERLGGRK